MRDLDQEFKDLYQDPKYIKGYKAGQKHSEPSQETKKFIEKQKEDNQKQQIIVINMENNIKNIFEKLKEMPTKDEMNTANRDMVEKVFTKMNEMMEKHEEKSDKKYAVKTVEKIVYSLAGMVLTSFGAGLIALVFRSGII